MKRSRFFSSLWVCIILFAVAQAIANLPSKAAWQAFSAEQPPVLAAQLVKPAVPTATFTVNSADDHDDAACTAGDCTLREAINAANSNGVADTITFAIGSGTKTINLLAALPMVTSNTTLDATTQPGYTGSPIIELNGASSGAATNGFNLLGSNCTIRGFVINRFTANGISINGSSNTVTGNYIGTNVAGTAALANAETGIVLNSGTNNVIGGTTGSLRNVISGNDGNGISVLGTGVSSSQILGNYIGTSAAGGLAIGNKGDGITIVNSSNNTIGSATPGAGNLISGNANGIHIIDASSTNNLIIGNFIGTDLSGTIALGNQFAGIDLFGASTNTIGGTSSGTRNVISGNNTGINLNNSATGNLIRGNLIGTKGDGISALGNIFNGVSINFSASNNSIGGVNAGEGNTIAFNRDNGVFIGSNSTGNAIQGNSIFSNTNLGIDLNPIGVTANDAGDTDLGANGLQNYPVLTSASTILGGGINIQGSLNSTASTTFRLEFFYNPSCDASGNGEGQSFIGAATVTTSAANTVSFNLNFATAVSGGSSITATATATTSPLNTSEFSPCVTSSSLADLTISQSASPNPVIVGSNLTFTITATNNGPDAVTSAVVTDNLSASLAFVSCNSTGGGVCGGAGNNRTVSLPTLASGASATITFVATVDCFLAHNATISNTASISSSISDPVANNSAASTTTVNHPAAQILPTSQAFPSANGNGTINVTFPAGCGWTAASNVGWITISSGSSGTGNGAVNYTVAANAAPTQRTGTITAAGLTFTVTQAGEVCSYTLSPSNASVPQTASTGSVSVTAPSSCGWKATTENSWIQVTSGSPGTGSAPFGYSVAANNTGASRSGSISVAGQTFAITQVSAPTVVKLISVQAKGYDGGVSLEWSTGQEVDNLGFNVYRDDNGQRVRMTPEIVAGSALIAGSGTVLSAGKTYAWWDALPKGKQNVQYWLEDIDLNGTRTLNGPFAPQAIGGQPAEKANAALLSKLGNIEPRIGVPSSVEQRTGHSATDVSQRATAWELAAKAAVKIGVREEGWYRVTQPELLSAGLDAKANPRFLQLYVDGVEQPIVVTGEADNSFDPNDRIEFYGTGLDTPSTNKQVYWLAVGTQPGKRVTVVKSAARPGGAQSFNATVERRDRSIYFSSLRNGEKENFFGAVIASNPVEQIIPLQHLSTASSEPAVIEVALQGITLIPHFVEVRLNGTSIGAVSFDGQAQGVVRLAVSQTLLREGVNQILLTQQGGQSDVSFVDYLRITYQRAYTAAQDALRCTADPGNGASQTIDGFSDPHIRVLDVTDSGAIRELLGNIEPQSNGYGVSVSLDAPSQRTLLAFTEAQIKRPSSITANRPSNWHDASNKADLVIIAHGNFINSLAPLKALREQQGFAVEVLDVEDIYDEYSFGEKQPRAIRDFLFTSKSSWRVAPRFVLFVGDASYDARNYSGAGDFDFVPSKLLDTVFMETTSDDWFADFNEDGLADMFVGRLPVRTNLEAGALVTKITGYDAPGIKAPVVKRSVLLVADRNDGFNFEEASNQLRSIIPTGYDVQEVYRGRMDDATAKRLLIDAINSGQAIVNYAGHGAVNLWRGVLSTNDLSALQNRQSLPLVVTMTCLNGYFHDLLLDSLAEGLLKAEDGGAIAVWASSALTEPNSQATMNQQMYRALFDASGSNLTLGEATARAKATVSDRDIRRTWILFGDPTTRLK
jgi:CSLREA domain-containing protein/uncharacterized repeat protein (TIGR01451 family)